MKITLKNSQDTVELIQAMASRDPLVRMEAQTAFAEFMGKVMAEAMSQAPTIGNLYTNLSYRSNTSPSIPLDLYADITDVGYFNVWSQHKAGGLGTNEVRPTQQEMYVDTYNINSAISFDKKHAQNSRLDVISKSMTRLMQEILFIETNYAVGPIMNAVAAASTNSQSHIFRTAVSGRFLISDLNNLITRFKRINTSWIKGTPAGVVGKPTDILLSPEASEELRSMAYNAINTKTSPQTSAIKDSVAAPESIRAQMFDSTGIPTFFGIAFQEFLEFGVGQRFNTVFDVAAGSTAYTDYAGGNSATFDGSASQIMLVVDRSRDSIIRLVETDAETGSEFTLSPDNQFEVYNRTGKMGFFGGETEGRLILDNRSLGGLIY